MIDSNTGTSLPTTASATNTTPTLRTFEFNDLSLRAIDRDGEPWFVAKDVCEALGLSSHNGGYGQHLSKLWPTEVTSTSDMEVKVPGKGMHSAKLVSESGLYKLIMRSNRPAAEKFQHWVCSEVLPAIRKTGTYTVKPKAIPLPARMPASEVVRTHHPSLHP